ncbi:MAG TPA: AAA family ATPase [Armatimonadota bacterium]|nr:AAA family ATPase [Armatimonadota bacterium]
MKRKAAPAPDSDTADPEAEDAEIARAPAEVRHRDELDRLAAADQYARPAGWRLSPRMVEKFILGDAALDIQPKFVGDRDLAQLAIASLASDRALLLTGPPGTAKSWLSEHLAAAISGTSQLVIQGTAGITEDQVKYTWNYALLLAEGPGERSLVPAPILSGMRAGLLVRFEEVTRCAPEVQDTLISILSEKAIAIPELEAVQPARRGFNVIATANTRDRGVNDMSAALRRRFSFVSLPALTDVEVETALVLRRTRELMSDYRIQAEIPTDAVATLVQIFAEIRTGQTLEGSAKVRRSEGAMSTAEAISSLYSAAIMAAHFGDGVVGGRELLQAVAGAITQEGEQAIFDEYLDSVVRHRQGRYWKEMYEIRRDERAAPGRSDS